jgi:hypothetical protein
LILRVLLHRAGNVLADFADRVAPNLPVLRDALSVNLPDPPLGLWRIRPFWPIRAAILRSG